LVPELIPLILLWSGPHRRGFLGIVAEMRVAHVDGLTGERLQGIRQLARLRHACPVDQNRDDSNVAGKRPRDFDRNEIIRIVEPSPAALVLHAQPVGTDDDQYAHVSSARFVSC
jgi:hypothetical protein